MLKCEKVPQKPTPPPTLENKSFTMFENSQKREVLKSTLVQACNLKVPKSTGFIGKMWKAGDERTARLRYDEGGSLTKSEGDG